MFSRENYILGQDQKGVGEGQGLEVQNTITCISYYRFKVSMVVSLTKVMVLRREVHLSGIALYK